MLRFFEEFEYDMDFREPRIIIKDNLCMIENVKSIVMIGETSLTVETQTKFVTINCDEFLIKEIVGGRILVEGKIKGVEILYASSKNKH